jgi:hypothetical protein
MTTSVKISKRFDSVDKIRAGIKSVLNRANTWRNDVQLLAVACINHAHQHGDWTLLRDLVDGITKVDGINKSKLKLWAETFMHASLLENDKEEMVFSFAKGKSVKDIDVEGAAAVNWYEFKVVKAEELIDLKAIEEKLHKLIVRGMKQENVTKEQAEIILAGVAGLIEAEAEQAEAA